MIQIGEIIVSLDIFSCNFCCDIAACKGACCVEGDAGAPVLADEIAKLEEVLPVIRKDLTPQALEVIDTQGVVYIDRDGDFVTSIVNGRDCVFAGHDAQGQCFCVIEKAFREGKVKFSKPISCHLYPIRVSKIGDMKALNYHRWTVCKPAVLLGKREQIPVYKYLQEPLTRCFGEKWYEELDTVAKELKKQGLIS